MKTYLDCIPCFLRQALEAARAVTTDEGVHRQVMKSVAGLVAELEPGVMPPEVVRQIYGLVTEISGNRDPYHAEKQRANRQALALYPRLKELVAESVDPLLTACKLAVASNSIDLGPGLKYGELDSIVELALASPLAVNLSGLKTSA
jgi:uncharacterized protein with ATP-grasp and redox domains